MTLKIISSFTLILMLSCSQPTKTTEIVQPEIKSIASKDEAISFNHKYNCDVSILDKRIKSDKTSEKEKSIGLVFLWRFYATVINNDRAKTEQYFNQLLTSLQENKINMAKIACDSLMSINKKSSELIISKKSGEEFEHFEKLLYCYYQTTQGNYTTYQNILLENSTTAKKYEKIYDLLQSSLDSDDKKWSEVYEEYDILPKKYGFGN
jgi:hypothetical protein